MKTLTLAGLLLLAACVPVPVKQWQEADRAPRPGDLVRIETREGKRHTFHVYKIDERAFYGTAKNNRQYRVPYKVVKTMEVRVTETEWVDLSLRPYF